MRAINRTVRAIVARSETAALVRRADDPCWKGYVQCGTKIKDGREVPNCVPIDKPEEAAGDSHKPPAAVAAAARKGLELRAQFKRGGTSIGVARARDLSGGRGVSMKTITRMNSYFARHAVDKQGKDWANKSNPSAGYIAWLLWGGEPGKTWAAKLAKQDA